MPHHILVLGATGPSGIDFCNAALRKQHRLTLYVRNASKVPPSIASSPNVTVLQGELRDSDGLQKAVSTGAKILVSFLGPIVGKMTQATTLAPAYELLIPMLKEHNINRAVILSTGSYDSPEDNFHLKWWLTIGLLHLLFPMTYRDVVGFSKFIQAVPVDQLRWTMFRLPNLGTGNAGPVITCMKGDSRDGWGTWNLERKSLAEWVLNEMEEQKWVGRAPLLYNG